MKIHTDYVGLKLEPKLKKECARRARAAKLSVSSWIRYALMTVIATAKPEGK